MSMTIERNCGPKGAGIRTVRLVNSHYQRKVHTMKKILIGMAAGAMALGASVVPAAAGWNETPGDSIWNEVDGTIVGQLVLIAGMATQLDACGNGKPYYTFFAPSDVVFEGVEQLDIPGLFEILGTSVAELQGAPDVVRGILNDHIVNGSFSPWDFEYDTNITRMVARSGFILNITRDKDGGDADDIFVSGEYVDVDDDDVQVCNGYVYWIDGFIDSTPQVVTEGLNALDTPQDGTPGGTNSLPDTL
jgi:uncharacterized surface protein with fasciclin (FAS1) repeats